MRTLLKLIVCASPSVYMDLAHAEVMDKLPQIPDFWLTSLLGLAVAAVALNKPQRHVTHSAAVQSQSRYTRIRSIPPSLAFFT